MAVLMGGQQQGPMICLLSQGATEGAEGGRTLDFVLLRMVNSKRTGASLASPWPCAQHMTGTPLVFAEGTPRSGLPPGLNMEAMDPSRRGRLWPKPR